MKAKIIENTPRKGNFFRYTRTTGEYIICENIGIWDKMNDIYKMITVESTWDNYGVGSERHWRLEGFVKEP